MKTFESFESNRWIWRVNLALQVVLVLALTAIVNYIGMVVYYRYDLTRTRAFSLSPETIAEVKNLGETVKIYVTLAADEEDERKAQAYRDVRGILREFEYNAHGKETGRIEVEFINIYQQRKRAETLGVGDQPDVVVFERGESRRVVPLSELYAVQNQELKQFKGERVFASAILEVSSRKRPVVYFITGHGEMRLDDVDPVRGASNLDVQLVARNFSTLPLDLTQTGRVPDDAELVVILSPTAPLLRAEQDILREWMSTKPGRMIVALDPGRPHGLDTLLEDWGIQASDVVVIEPSTAHQIPGGDILIKTFDAKHPITQALAENQMSVLFGRTRAVREDIGRPLDSSLEVTMLLATSSVSWGESGYKMQGAPRFNAASSDLRGPVPVATVAERKVDSKLGINLKGGRIIAFGGSDFVANNRIDALGNFTLFYNALSWAINRDASLDIPARPLQQLELSLSQEQLTLAGITILFGPGLLVALVGIGVYIARRR